MSGATIEDGRQRFGAVHLALAADPDPCEIKVGCAAATPQDTAAELIQRADRRRDRERVIRAPTTPTGYWSTGRSSANVKRSVSPAASPSS